MKKIKDFLKGVKIHFMNFIKGVITWFNTVDMVRVFSKFIMKKRKEILEFLHIFIPYLPKGQGIEEIKNNVYKIIQEMPLDERDKMKAKEVMEDFFNGNMIVKSLIIYPGGQVKIQLNGMQVIVENMYFQSSKEYTLYIKDDTEKYIKPEEFFSLSKTAEGKYILTPRVSLTKAHIISYKNCEIKWSEWDIKQAKEIEDFLIKIKALLPKK